MLLSVFPGDARLLCYIYISCTVNPELPGRIGHSLSMSHTADVYNHNAFNEDQNHQMFGSLVGNERF